MFLRNKHTDEVIEWEKNITYKVGKTYKSLKDLQEDWEDFDCSSCAKTIQKLCSENRKLKAELTFLRSLLVLTEEE